VSVTDARGAQVAADNWRGISQAGAWLTARATGTDDLLTEQQGARLVRAVPNAGSAGGFER
jgi:hypothetical protein